MQRHDVGRRAPRSLLDRRTVSADRGRATSVSGTSKTLLLASGLMLFLELALIRWLGANVVHLSYFSNFVLLGSFLGIGLGLLLARQRWSGLAMSAAVLAGLVAVVLVLPVRIDRSSSEIIYFTSVSASGPPPWVMLPAIFCAVALILIGPAQVVGRCFQQLAPLEAYRLDLLGSLAGIVAFTALSFLHAPSVVWGLVTALAFLGLLRKRPPVYVAVALLSVVGMLGMESLSSGVSWSPYYKVTTFDDASEEGAVHIAVNGVPHQVIRSTEARLTQEAQYSLPYERLSPGDSPRVLIIGAGSGSDVAVALDMGASHVDAVEIDPRIQQIGEQRHPDRPYQSASVETHIEDGRAFLERSPKRYDLVLFALPDSLALVNGASAIRLESYLFTTEAIEAARERLRPGGGLALYNYYREDRLIDRLAGTVADSFGHEPCVDRVGLGQAVISVGLTEEVQTCGAQRPIPDRRATPPSDDRPFLYFFGSFLPSIYVIALAGILVISLVSVRVLAGPFRSMRPFADLFFMGAAFLLLETKNVSTFALLFGTTWLVNAIVFAGVLVAVLLAVETTRRLPTPRLPVVYAGIAVSLGAAMAMPNSILLQLPFGPRVVAATALAFAPIYLANVAFAKRFAQVEDAPSAFGVNILGAMCGGCLEYFSLLTGFRNLLIVAGFLYLAAFLLTPRAVVSR